MAITMVDCRSDFEMAKLGTIYYIYWNMHMALLCFVHYTDVIMSAIASQITGVSIVCSTVCSSADQRKHQSSGSLAFVGESTGHRWIPLTKGQQGGKYFYLMTSSWVDACNLLPLASLHCHWDNQTGNNEGYGYSFQIMLPDLSLNVYFSPCFVCGLQSHGMICGNVKVLLTLHFEKNEITV